ncbi:MAG TPA: 16S rRNA (adenine(1518)-N(6)/adenine(1519)-N(6))-dimethyltransferase RsmA [Stellaceae bacterium]|nr:16S rRNA (adenine(1518)-N(6)/adenine(1519)-N(6))-dimethyltransferase RsmA [Stellaceae bacterium]
MAEPDLPPLRDVIRRHGLDAKKSLGQNFLLDINLTRRIARAAGALDQCDTIEIGPGPGGLTRALLAEGARHVIAVERDRRCIAALEELAAAYPGRLDLVEGDALALDAAALGRAPRKIVANLPYNIATRLLLQWLKQAGAFAGLTLMFQKEVAARLAAEPGAKEYGRLSVIAQHLCAVELEFDVAASAFVPRPTVTSTVVNLMPLARPRGACRLEDLERVTAAAFGQRRKMLRQSLRSLGGDPAALLEAARITPTARAEELSVEAFATLAAAMAGRASG